MANVLRLAARAVLYPAAPAPMPGIARRLMQTPRAFDLLTLALQLRDMRRQRKINDRYAFEDTHYRKVQDYNAGVTLQHGITRTRRAETLLQGLSAGYDVRDENLLLVGPRDIHEFLLAWLQGYRWRNISGIDLYSTNPKIAVMNMEAMEFESESFDALCMANTLAYAKDTERCLRECVRVLRPGGRFAFGATYFPEGEYPGNKICGQAIREMLQALPVDLCFHRPLNKTNALGKPQTVHLFGYTKRDPQTANFDSVVW